MKWNEGSFHDQWKGSSAASESILTYICLLGRQINPNSTFRPKFLLSLSSLPWIYPFIPLVLPYFVSRLSIDHVYLDEKIRDIICQINWNNFIRRKIYFFLQCCHYFSLNIYEYTRIYYVT